MAVANLRDAEGRGGPGVERGPAPPLPGRRPGGAGVVFPRHRAGRATSATDSQSPAPGSSPSPRDIKRNVRAVSRLHAPVSPFRRQTHLLPAPLPAGQPRPLFARPGRAGPGRSAVRRWRICGGERAGRGRPWRLAPAAVWRLFLLRGSPEAPGKVPQCGVRARINPVKAGDKVRGSVPAALGRRLAVERGVWQWRLVGGRLKELCPPARRRRPCLRRAGEMAAGGRARGSPAA